LILEARSLPNSWIGDTILGGFGAFLLGVWTWALFPNPFLLIPFLGFCGSLYLIGRAVWMQNLVYVLDDQGVLTRQVRFLSDTKIDLSALTRADLHYLGTLLRGARGTSGLFVLHLAQGSSKMRIESKIDGFHAIATAALQAHVEAGHTISLATYDNANALEIDAGLKTTMVSRPL